MGISSVINLVNADFAAVHEEDFDKALDGALAEIAGSLPQHHPFRRLMDLLDDGEDVGETLIEKIGDAIGSDDATLGFVVVPCDRLAEFSDYVRGDVAVLWDGLFPGKQPGLANWLNYRLRLKPLERQYKTRPPRLTNTAIEIGWYRDDFETLLHLIDRAIRERCWIVRGIY